MRLAIFGLVAVCLSALIGCGNNYPIAPVSGTVTYNGAPLPNAQVMFSPAEGRPSVGTTDENGHYELAYTGDEKGALIGEHTVRISTAIVLPDDSTAAEKLPAKYHSKSTVTRTVESGGSNFDFDLVD